MAAFTIRSNPILYLISTVSLIDKSVAVYELYRFKFKMVINIWAIFLFNVITLNK